MMKPILDTRDSERIRLAQTVLAYPAQYCLHNENLQRITRLLPQAEGVARLVQTLRAAQTALAPHLPLQFGSTWKSREELSSACFPATSYAGKQLTTEDVKTFARTLDLGLLEEGLEMMSAADAGAPSNPDALRLALGCSWLSQHLALIAVGLASAEITSKGDLALAPADSEAVRHLRRLWFAAAFEEMSLRKAQASVEIYALLAGRQKHLNGDVEEAFADAVSVIPQHWRLPVEEGPVAALLHNQLMPLLWMVGRAIHAAKFDRGRPVVLADVPPKKAFRQVFSDLMAHQLALPPLNRVFDVRKGGLVLGPTKIAPGLLRIAEDFATAKLGATWHDKDLSNTQKKYLIRRLTNLPNVEVLDVELSKHDTTDDVHIDVDLFVRDRLNDMLFAVQLKHFRYSDKGGLRYWLGRFQPGKAMSHAVAQLESLGDLAKSDMKVRAKLMGRGLTSDELESVVPVVLHNIGFLDCLEFQKGVLAYDQHTFVNVLDGRSAVGVGVVDGRAVSLRTGGGGARCRLSDPDEVVSAYVNDPQFADLRAFDAACETERCFEIMGATVSARGLGI